jgi:hypothetical protein
MFFPVILIGFRNLISYRKDSFIRFSEHAVSLDFRLSPWNEVWFLVLVVLHGVRGKFPDDVLEAAVDLETSSGNLPRTPCKIPKTKNQYAVSFFRTDESDIYSGTLTWLWQWNVLSGMSRMGRRHYTTGKVIYVQTSGNYFCNRPNPKRCIYIFVLSDEDF